MQEHLERAKMFLDEALHETNVIKSYRKQIAATYFGRAALEIMRETAKSGNLKCSIKELDLELSKILPRYSIIKAIRIHDFHHFAITPSSITIIGKNKIPPKQTIYIVIDPNNELPIVSFQNEKGEKINGEFLTMAGTLVQDKQDSTPEPLANILKDYTSKLPNAIKYFQSQL